MKKILGILMSILSYEIIVAQSDTLKNYSIYFSGGISLNAYTDNKIKIATHSPIGISLESGFYRKISNKVFLGYLGFQSISIKKYYKEFYDFNNLTSVAIDADFLLYKLNGAIMAGVYWKNFYSFIGIGASYVMDAKFKLNNFGCMYPYGSIQYQTIRDYYYYAFNKDSKNVIYYRVIAPYLNFKSIYNLNTKWALLLDIKYELSKIPDNNKEWYFFRLTPVVLGMCYYFD